jgi:AcrR family transcriptional regulator
MVTPMDSPAVTVKRERRKRRSREDVTQRIRDAARQLFAERGYAATTTKEIAAHADVSETLLFRYYGGKAGLFDEVVSAPFDSLMDAFAERHADASADGTREADLRQLVDQIFKLFDENRETFSALMLAPRTQTTISPSGPQFDLQRYFEQAARQIEMHFSAQGKAPPFDVRVAAPLAFGMIASGVLLRDWLFPARAPSRGEVTNALGELIVRALAPRAGD